METPRTYKTYLGILPIAPRIGVLALIMLGIASEMAYRIQFDSSNSAPRDCGSCLIYDSRGMPYYYRTQNKGDTMDFLFYYDTPIEGPRLRF